MWNQICIWNFIPYTMVRKAWDYEKSVPGVEITPTA